MLQDTVQASQKHLETKLEVGRPGHLQQPFSANSAAGAGLPDAGDALDMGVRTHHVESGDSRGVAGLLFVRVKRHSVSFVQCFLESGRPCQAVGAGGSGI